MAEPTSARSRAATAAWIIAAIAAVVAAPVVIGIILVALASGRADFLSEATSVFLQTMTMLGGCFVLVFAIVLIFNLIARHGQED